MPLHKDKTKIYLFSDDITLLELWEENLEDFKCEVVYDFSLLNDLKDELIIVNTTSLNNILVVLENFVKNKNKVLLLDNIINFGMAKRYLQIGIMGYGNQFMSKLFLNSAIVSIIENYVWLHPKITQDLIGEIGEKKQIQQENKILESLTKREKQIALKLTQSLTNEQISEQLNISVNTLKTHIKKIYEKLNIKDRVSLALILK